MGKAWFAPKRYGYGAGAPVSWEGWSVLLALFAGLFAVLYLPRHLTTPDVASVVSTVGAVVLIAVFILIAKAKTDGGWHWRNGP